MHIIYSVLYYLSLVSILGPFVCGLIKIKTLDIASRVLFSYVIVSIVAEVISYKFNYLTDIYFTTQNLFVLLEFLLFTIIYLIEFRTRSVKVLILITTVCFFAYALKIYLNLGTIEVQESNLSVLESMILIVFALYFFFQVLVDLRIKNILSYPFYWLNVAVILYFTSSIMLFLFDDFISHATQEAFERIWSLHLFGNIVFNTLLSIALWKARLN